MQTYEQKLRLILEPDMGPVNKAVDDLQTRLNNMLRTAAAAAGTSTTIGTPTPGLTTPGTTPPTPAPTTTTTPTPTRPTTPSHTHSFGGGAAFAGGVAGVVSGRAMGVGFLEIMRGRASPFPIIAQALGSTTFGLRLGQGLFGAHAMRGAMRAARAHAARIAARPPSMALVPRIGRFLGAGVGGVGPMGGALVGGGLAAAGAGMILASAVTAVRQFTQGVHLYVQASQRLVSAVTNADPTQLLLAGTTAQQAAIRLNMYKGIAATTAAGGAFGAVVGGTAGGGGGAVIGGLLGAGAGGLGAAMFGSVMAWLKNIELKIQETLFGGLDALFHRLENYNGIIFGLARQFEMQQNIFLFKLGHATTALAQTWFNLKMATMDFMTTILSSGALKPVMEAIISYLKQIQMQLPQIIGGLLTGVGSLIVAFVRLTEMINNFVTGFIAGSFTGGLIGGFAGGTAGVIAGAPPTGKPANATQVQPGFIGPLAPNQKVGTGLMGIGLALQGAGLQVGAMPPPGQSQLGTLPMQTFAANFANLAFGQPGSQGYPVGRGQAGYPGIRGLGAPQSGAMMAMSGKGRPTRGTTYAPNSAQAQAAAQAGKAPTATFPKFTQNIQMEFKAKIAHEKEVYDALQQVRERLLETLDTSKNEARLCISLLDARMQAMSL